MQADTAPILSIQKVTKKFGTFTAVDNVTIEVNKGEVFGFLGPNGAGKSTTIRLLLDILRPTSGEITIDGIANTHTKQAHANLGFLSGDMVMDIDLTGRQYLEFISGMYGGTYSAEIDRLAQILDANLNVKIGTYSRGNRQKIGLIAALLHKPNLLVLDEPTSGFDPLVQEKFARLIREYVDGGGTVFMSSHVLAEVQHLCDRVAFIKDGKIITTTSVHELLDTTAKRVHITAQPKDLTKIKSAAKKISSLKLLEEQDSSVSFSYAGNMPALLKFLADKPLTDLTIREPELEEIFGQYYGETDA